MSDDLIKAIIEVLNPAQRRAKGRVMKRLAPKIARKKKIAMRKKATPDKLVSRAEKAAKVIVRKRMLKGRDYDELPFAQRELIDKRVNKKKELIAKIAKRILPQIKKKEVERFKNLNKNK